MEAPVGPQRKEIPMFQTFRNLFRRGIPVLVLLLALAGAAPAAAQPSFPDRWDGLWGWVVSLWSDGETSDGDRGLGLDPNGLASGGDRGAAADPNGSTSTEEGDRGAGLDPNG
jgi:hypothetical protein